LVKAEPFKACGPLENAEEMKNKIVIAERGECMFNDKVRRTVGRGECMFNDKVRRTVGRGECMFNDKVLLTLSLNIHSPRSAITILFFISSAFSNGPQALNGSALTKAP
jgi:hypothetical protein